MTLPKWAQGRDLKALEDGCDDPLYAGAVDPSDSVKELEGVLSDAYNILVTASTEHINRLQVAGTLKEADEREHRYRCARAGDLIREFEELMGAIE